MAKNYISNQTAVYTTKDWQVTAERGFIYSFFQPGLKGRFTVKDYCTFSSNGRKGMVQ